MRNGKIVLRESNLWPVWGSDVDTKGQLVFLKDGPDLYSICNIETAKTAKSIYDATTETDKVVRDEILVPNTDLLGVPYHHQELTTPNNQSFVEATVMSESSGNYFDIFCLIMGKGIEFFTPEKERGITTYRHLDYSALPDYELSERVREMIQEQERFVSTQLSKHYGPQTRR